MIALLIRVKRGRGMALAVKERVNIAPRKAQCTDHHGSPIGAAAHSRRAALLAQHVKYVITNGGAILGPGKPIAAPPPGQRLFGHRAVADQVQHLDGGGHARARCHRPCFPITRSWVAMIYPIR